MFPNYGKQCCDQDNSENVEVKKPWSPNGWKEWKCQDQPALVAAPVPSHEGWELDFPFTLSLNFIKSSSTILTLQWFYNCV